MLERQLLVGMIEALRINLKNEKDAGFIVGKILALVNCNNKAKNAEIQNEFYKYDPKTPVIRIFVE
jgi:hypothetical protein